MRKRCLPIILTVVVLLCTTVNAVILKTRSFVNLEISNSCATCSACVTDYGQAISASMELWEGSVLVAAWSDTGTTQVSMSGVYNNTKAGKTYTLKLNGTVNGVAIPEKEVVRYT